MRNRVWWASAAALMACGGAVREGAPEDSEAPAGGAGAPDDAGEPMSEPGSNGGAASSRGASGSGAAAQLGLGGREEREPLGCSSESSRFASTVVAHHFGGGQNFNQVGGFPDALLGPPVAGDTASVVSLGNGGWVVLEFLDNAIVDGPGTDFLVFENPLPDFAELGTVAVSNDLVTWYEFPCVAAQDASDYGLCAGVRPVESSPDNGVDALDPTVSGGDPYDLGALGLTRARYVRVTDRADLEGLRGVFDLDAVGVVHALCTL